MAPRPRVVVLGAGLLATAVADELTAAGWTDVTVLEQAPEHDAPDHGLVFRTHPDRTATEFAKYTVEKYSALTVDGGWCFQPVGSLTLATTPERLAALRRQHGWATSWGMRSYLRTPAECAQLHPLLDPAKLLGGLHVPDDGLADPARAAVAQARRASARGARFVPGQQVVEIVRGGGRVTAVRTGTDRFRADVVVSCAGVRGPELGRLVDLPVPVVPMPREHARSTPLPELAGQNDEFTEAGKPVLSHPDAGLSLREHVDRLGVLAFGRHPGEHVPFSPSGFEEPWARAAELVPALAEGKVEEGSRGLVPMTPDGLPLLGEHPDLDGFWVAEALGTAWSAGVARELARWLVDGQARLALHTVDLARFDRLQLAPDHLRTRSIASAHARPAEPVTARRTSPFYEREVALGANFREADGWARPQWYAANERLPEISWVPQREAELSPIGGAEALVARSRVAMFDLTPRRRLEITGPGALPFLQALTTNQLDRPHGTVVSTLLLGEDGGVRSELTVARLGTELFQVAVHSHLDVDWLYRHLPRDGAVQLRETTSGTCCVGLWGPLARQVLPKLSTLDSTSGVKARHAYAGDVPVLALRVSEVGEPGWELHTSADLGRRLWDAVWEAGRPHGIIAAGQVALTSLRLEEGHRECGIDVTTEHDPYEAGLGFAVRMDKGYFLGRDTLRERSPATVSRKLACLIVEDPHSVLLGKEPVYAEGRPAGYVTSAAYGYTVGKNLAHAWLPVEYAKPRTPLEIELAGRRLPAKVAAEPLRSTE
ncbi:FAD-dependent oxidoreductase [Amycolatopsis jiangsuensis]|uniref:Glycine cleavage system aminomethyltransferase T/glycine/D-amino acid oxidase-like deaminating enzyme n=1 Tax=Amycolatopsis jiangsuensis TaxID=1181879 RepID=A0A840J0B0_9PSEU|nr:FAD-dependent oxidoreductase [Amycolatopsis jiangsuensis]MBB4688551.1 glycine cleavage system aminomethyltransferase T/glycine/D-amino acid oxidase-like deaminating enzyme [Amycolatopsis jiangsuensis]